MRITKERLVLAAFLGEALLAGGNGVAVRFSNRELAPLWGASLRFVLAATLLLVLAASLKIPLPRGRELTGALLYGLLQFTGAFGLIYYALVEIQAGLGQTLLALVPLAALLLAVLQGQERLHARAVIGTLIGLGGVGLVSRAPLQSDVSPLSLLAVLGSVLCFAQAAVLVRRFPPVHPVAMNTVGMLFGAVTLLGGSLLLGEPHVVPQNPSTWIALAYVSAAGSVVVFLLHVFVLHHWPASQAAYVMVVIPFVAVLLSAWLDNEPISAGLILGGVLVVAGVYIGAIYTRGKPERAT